MKRLETISAYLECSWRNKFVRYSVMLLLIELVAFFVSDKLCHYLLFPAFAAVITLCCTEFGYTSYRSYRRATILLELHKKMPHTEIYFGRVGCIVAMRRFRKKHPKRFVEIVTNERRNNMGCLILVAEN